MILPLRRGIYMVIFIMVYKNTFMTIHDSSSKFQYRGFIMYHTQTRLCYINVYFHINDSECSIVCLFDITPYSMILKCGMWYSSLACDSCLNYFCISIKLPINYIGKSMKVILKHFDGLELHIRNYFTDSFMSQSLLDNTTKLISCSLRMLNFTFQ